METGNNCRSHYNYLENNQIHRDKKLQERKQLGRKEESEQSTSREVRVFNVM